MTEQRKLVEALLDRHPQSYAQELGIDPHGGPSHLFRLLCAALLLSARIRSSVAVDAARALVERGWTTPQKLAGAPWTDRTRTLKQAGYARYDERTASMLGDTAAHCLDRYDGDLRRLREDAGRDPRRERTLLKEFKGVGDVGVDIFCREVQVEWSELHPFVDERAAKAAVALGLPGDASSVAALVPRADLPRLLGALVRVQLDKAHDEVREAAAS